MSCPSPTASSVRSEAAPVPPAIAAMPPEKLRVGLAKAIMNLKNRDSSIATLKAQLKDLQREMQGSKAATTAASAGDVEAAQARAAAAEADAAAAQEQVATLVQASKDAGTRASQQIEDLSRDLADAKRRASEAVEEKEMHKQQVQSLKAAYADAVADKEQAFEMLGTARERNAELQDALREANGQIRMLRVEVAALHSEMDAELSMASNLDRDASSRGDDDDGDVQTLKEQLSAMQGELERARDTARNGAVTSPTAARARREGDSGAAARDALEAELEAARADLAAARAALAATEERAVAAAVTFEQRLLESDKARRTLAEQLSNALGAANDGARADQGAGLPPRDCVRVPSSSWGDEGSWGNPTHEDLGLADGDAVVSASTSPANHEAGFDGDAVAQLARARLERDDATAALAAARAELQASAEAVSALEVELQQGRDELAAVTRALEGARAEAQAAAASGAGSAEDRASLQRQIESLTAALDEARAALHAAQDAGTSTALDHLDEPVELRCSPQDDDSFVPAVAALMEDLLVEASKRASQEAHDMESASAGLADAVHMLGCGKRDETETQARHDKEPGAEQRVQKLQHEVERLRGTEVQTSEELSRKLEELAAERSKVLELERQLVDAVTASKQDAAWLQSEVERLREQLLRGAADEEMQAHMDAFVRTKEALAEALAEQEEALEALWIQVQQHAPERCVEQVVELRIRMSNLREGLEPGSGSASRSPSAAGLSTLQRSASAEQAAAAGGTNGREHACERCSALETELDEARAKQHNAETDLRAVQAHASEQAARLAGELAQGAQEAESQVRDAAERVAAAEAHAYEAEARAAAAEARCEELQTSQAEASQQCAAAENRVGELQQKAQSAHDRVAKLQASVAALEQRGGDSEASASEAAAAVARVGAERDAAMRRCEELAAERDHAFARLDEAFAALTKARSDLGDARGALEAEALARDEAQQALDAAAASGATDAKRKTAAALRKARALHEAQLAELREQLDGAKRARHDDVVVLERRVAAEAERAEQAVSIAAARAQAVEDAVAERDAAVAAAGGRAAEAVREAEERMRAAVTDAEAARRNADAAAARVAAMEAQGGESAAAAQAKLAEVEAAMEKAVKDAGTRETRLKKALAEMKHKLDAAIAAQMRAEATEAEARDKLDAAVSTRAKAEALSGVLQAEVDRLGKEGRDYRARAQALLAAKDREIERLRSESAASSSGPQTGVAEALALVSQMREELAAKAAAADEAASSAAEELRRAESRAAASAADADDLRESLHEAHARLQDARAAAAAAEAEVKRMQAEVSAATAARDRARSPSAPASTAQADSLRAQLTSTQQEFVAFKEMSSRMAEQREEALSAALEQLAEARAALAARGEGARDPLEPKTPPLAAGGDLEGWPSLKAIRTTPAAGRVRDADNGTERSNSFDMDRVMSMPAQAQGVAEERDSAQLEALLSHAYTRLAAADAELAEIAADLEKSEAQVALLKEELRNVERSRQREETAGNAAMMEFLKANIINMYCTGEAERLLGPLSEILRFSAAEVRQCRQGLERLQNGEAPLSSRGLAGGADSAGGGGGFFSGLFGLQ